MNKKQYRYINDAKSSTSVSIDEVTQGFFFLGGGGPGQLLFCYSAHMAFTKFTGDNTDQNGGRYPILGA